LNQWFQNEIGFDGQCNAAATEIGIAAIEMEVEKADCQNTTTTSMTVSQYPAQRNGIFCGESLYSLALAVTFESTFK
jgi:hypothetical protein